MQLQINSEGESMGVASDRAIDERPGVGKGKQRVDLQRGKLENWSCLVHQTNKQTNKQTNNQPNWRKFSVSSYYPNHGDTTHVLASLDPKKDFAHNSDTNNDNFEDEDDWFKLDDCDLLMTRKVSVQTSEAMMTEVSLYICSIAPSWYLRLQRPSWQVDASLFTPSVSTPDIGVSGSLSGRSSAVSTPCSTPRLSRNDLGTLTIRLWLTLVSSN